MPTLSSVKRPHSAHIPQPVAAAENPDSLLKISTVAALAGIGISTVYHRARTDSTFPRLIKHGTRCTRVRAGDLTVWLKAQAA
jgi:prophage regulatory protein